MTTESHDPIDHVYTTFIKASPERVWRAITDGDDTVRYYFGTRVSSDWALGSSIAYNYPDGSLAADGRVLIVESGRSVTMDFHPRWSPEIEAEGPVRMTWSVEPADGGMTKLTVTSALVPGSRADAEFRTGNAYIVSGLKTFLETRGAVRHRLKDSSDGGCGREPTTYLPSSVSSPG